MEEIARAGRLIRLAAGEIEIAPRGAPSGPVLRVPSLLVGPGEWLAITGTNGSGKTTLALGLAGLLPVRGRLELDGVPFGPAARAARRRVAVVLQEPADQLFQGTVADEIAFDARNLGGDEGEVAIAVRCWSTRLGIAELLERDPSRLSAGEQQMVLMAAALAQAPDLLVADEAGAHLDPEARARLLAAMETETRRGLSVIWVTQEPHEIAAAHRVVALGSDGRIEEPPPDSVLDGMSAPDPPTPSPASGSTRLEVVVTPGESTGPRIACGPGLRFTIAPGSITALVGRNGTGKSVLLTALAGVGPLSQVRSQWNVPPEVPPILVGAYPERQVFAETVAAEVAYGARARGADPERALEQGRRMFDRLQLDGTRFLARRTWELSTGERRLVEVVAALVAPASLVLLDEPSCGIDTARRHTLATLLGERSRQDPVVLATQDLAWAKSLGATSIPLGMTSSGGMPSHSKKTD